jgi:hypothetical protein
VKCRSLKKYIKGCGVALGTMRETIQRDDSRRREETRVSQSDETVLNVIVRVVRIKGRNGEL